MKLGNQIKIVPLMKLNIQLTEEDYIKANYLHLRPSAVIKCAVCVLLLFVLFTLAVSVHVAIGHPEEIWTPVWISAMLAYLWLVFGFWMPRRCRKTFRQQKAMQVPHLYELTDELFVNKAEYGETTLTWDYFRKWKEGKEVFTVYQSDRIMQIIPKRAFASPEEMAEFRELLTKKIGAAWK